MKDLNINNVSLDIHGIVSHNPELVKKVGIFGSLARGDFNSDSDIDILIEYASTPNFQFERFTQFCELCNQINDTLINLYRRKVDIVHFEDNPLNNLSDDNAGEDIVWL